MTSEGQPTDQATGVPPTDAPPAAVKPGWQVSLDRLIERVLAIPLVHLVMSVVDIAGQAGVPLFSAALAFTTLFAVFPLMLLFAGVLGWLINDPVQRDALLAELVSLFPPLEDLLSQSLKTVVDQRGTLTVVGVVGLLWGASSYYAALDEVMRRLFAGAIPRNIVEQRLRGIVTVIVLIVLMIGTLVLTSIGSFITGVTGSDQILRLISPVVALAITCLVVLAIYLFVPMAPPSLRAALPAAIVAGVAIGLLTSLFGFLAPWLIGGMLAFGVIATVFAALVWLNFTYQILLYGAAWARVRRDLEGRRRAARARARGREESAS